MTPKCLLPRQHILSVATDGTLRCLWTDDLPLAEMGQIAIDRASTIEFAHEAQQWQVLINGEVAFSHPSRENCLAWEHRHFNDLLRQP
jgi:hypothetical protein